MPPPPSHGPPPHQPYGYAAPYGYAGYAQPPVKRPWTVPVPAGLPYHRLARTAVHRWWRPLVGTLALVAGALVATLALTIIGTVGYALATGELPTPSDSETSIFGEPVADLAFNLAAIAMLLPVVLFVPWLAQRRRPGTLSSVTGRLRRRWLLVCCAAAVGFCALSFGAAWVAGHYAEPPSGGGDAWVGWDDFLPPALIIVALVPFQASAEEYIFRGWLPQAIGVCTLEGSGSRAGRALSAVLRTPWPGIVIASAAFTAGHGYTGWGVLDIFLFGAIAAWVTVRTGGLEASIALHVFNNLMAFLLPAAAGKLDLKQGDIPWQFVVADVVPLLLYAAVVVWLARRLRVETVTGDPGPQDAPVHAPAVSGQPVGVPAAAPYAPSGVPGVPDASDGPDAHGRPGVPGS